MSLSTNSRWLLPTRDLRVLLLKWLVALLVPVIVFTFAWSGEAIANNVFLGIFAPKLSVFDTPSWIQAGVFLLLLYGTLIALAGYMVAADSGRRGLIELWIDVLFFVLIPLLLVYFTLNLLIGLGLSAVIWAIYFFARKRIRTLIHYNPPPPLENVQVIDAERRALLISRAQSGGFWFATIFALITFIADLAFYSIGQLPSVLLLPVIVRTILLPVAGYLLGWLGGVIAVRRTIAKNTPVLNGKRNGNGKVTRADQLKVLSSTRAREEARDLVPNDQPLQSRGAWRFYLTLLGAFVLFYPILDPVLFQSGTVGRLTSYGDLGYYIILALGLNIVVGFAGLLDLGYVAFFVLGTYAWAMVGSGQFTVLTGIQVTASSWSWLFWPMLLGSALFAALCGVLLGIPTLRLRGDYLAIVTLGFGEIIPIIFLNMAKYTRGTNGIVGIFPPATPCFPGFCIDWSSFNPAPYYYLILALIVICIFANVRLRDSRLGRAWVAIREDEIAASSSGINLVNTKLFAFGAGAFFSGIAGAYHAAKLGTVSPGDFNSTDSIIYLAMVVIGGLGSIPGVIVGAVVVYALNVLILAQLDTIASDPNNILHVILQVDPVFTFSSIRNLLFGGLLIVIMIFRPEGLIPSARRRRELHHTADDAPEITSLDEPPGTAAFEEEMHVE